MGTAAFAGPPHGGGGAPHAAPAPHVAAPAPHVAPAPHISAPVPHMAPHVALVPHVVPHTAPVPHVSPKVNPPTIPHPAPVPHEVPHVTPHETPGVTPSHVQPNVPGHVPGHAVPMPLPHPGFGPHPRTGVVPSPSQFAPHPHGMFTHVVHGLQHKDDQKNGRASYIYMHHHFKHYGEHGYYRGGVWYADDSYPVYLDTIPDDYILPPIDYSSTLVMPTVTADNACYVNIPQDQVLDIRNLPEGKVISSVENGTEVLVITRVTVDDQTWTLVKLVDPNNPDNYLGWVPNDYLQCE